MMRVEAHEIGSVMHVVQRGARGMPIVRDENDRKRFVRSLFYLNDTHSDPYWHEAVQGLANFTRPDHWPEREPLVHLLGWTLLDNHFHLVLEQIRGGGIAKFMQRLCGSMTTCFNAKYQERGSLFQGGYRGVLVSGDEHLNYLAFYVLVKNVLEMYPGGLSVAARDFDSAWEWAKRYPYSSLCSHIEGMPSPILDDPEALFGARIGTGDAYKREARELLEFHVRTKGEEYALLASEAW